MLKKIIQIIPAPDWFAVYKVDDKEEKCRLVCWALHKDEDGLTSVDGMDTDDTGITEISSNTSNFLRYEYCPQK